MVKKKPKVLLIRTARQLRALRTPLRQELMNTLSLLGAASVRELAEALGKTPAALYYHVHELESAGIIREASTRSAGTRSEAVYEPAAEQIRIDRTKRSKPFLAALKDLHRAALNQAGREIERALDARDGVDDGVMLVRLSARLSREDAREAQKMLSELAAFLSEHGRAECGDAFALTASLTKLQ